ncbi:helix-turn-helix domain-containing protein [Actinomadura harenae]|nr:helix-turn-helix transcriptional regulator [Actinomadura harenae]
MHDEETIGTRLRRLRRWRGMTLDQLAGQAGLSKSFLSMAERGVRAVDRRSHIAALAAALRVSEAELAGGPHLTADPVQAGPHALIPALRIALTANTLTAPVAERARPLPDLTAEVGRIDRSEYRHSEVAVRLPVLIDELHVHACAADEHVSREALASLVDAFQAATFTSKDLGYADLAHIAALRAAEVAGVLDDAVDQGKADSLRVHTLPTGSREFRLTMAERAADRLEPHAGDPLGLQVLGMLTLAAALSATLAHRFDVAAHWLDEASALASRVPDEPGRNWGAFSSANVAVWRVGLATERGEGGGVLLDLAREVDEDRIAARPGRHATFLADVGRGLARERATMREAQRWLLRAETLAPHKIRNSSAVRESVATMLTRATVDAGGRELRGLAARMGVAH